MINLSCDRNLRLKHMELSIGTFWIGVERECPSLAKKVLMQFSTSYLCELGFSTLNNIKTNKREKFLNIAEEMRGCLSESHPNFDEILNEKQSHVSN